MVNKSNEQISALMDGEAGEYEAAGALARLQDDDEARETWTLYHLAGDALRQSEGLASDVANRVSRRLRDEPTVLAPRRSPPAATRVAALSAVASVAAVAMVFWVAQQIASVSPAASGPLAQVVQPGQQLARPAVDRMNDYMLAHQEVSPSTAIHGLAPYVRAVSESRPERTR